MHLCSDGIQLLGSIRVEDSISDAAACWRSMSTCCSINLDGVLMVLGLEEMEFEDTFFPLPLFLLPLWKPTHLRLGMSDLKEAIVGVEESEVCR
ncbi:uncharacterized protein [Euphorbia lathyris]|uniref:uncharacterized protein isoform X2 n=1 Tax=Euphorbia lathyris TaxID=212925 RepID=UPI0033133B2E